MRSIDDAVDILRFLETDIGGTGIIRREQAARPRHRRKCDVEGRRELAEVYAELEGTCRARDADW